MSKFAIVDGGTMFAAAELVKNKDKWFKKQLSECKPLVRSGTSIGEMAFQPWKNYGTKGLQAPKNPNFTTLEFRYKMMKDRGELDNEGNFVYWSLGESKKLGSKAGVPLLQCLDVACDAYLEKNKINPLKAEEKFIRELQGPFDEMAQGNMTLDVELMRTALSHEALENFVELININDIEIQGTTWFNLIDANNELRMLEKVKVREFDKDGEFEVKIMERDDFLDRIFLHYSFNKNEEKGKPVPRNICCMSPSYKVDCKVLEAAGRALLYNCKNEVITVGGCDKDERIRNILNDEELLLFSTIMTGAEDKTGWNRQIMAKVLEPCVRRLMKGWSDRNIRIVINAIRNVAWKKISLRKFKLYDERTRTYALFYLDEIPWEKLPKRYKELFFNSKIHFERVQKEVLDKRLKDPLNISMDLEDCMMMGFFGVLSTLLREIFNSLYQILLDLFIVKQALEEGVELGGLSDAAKVKKAKETVSGKTNIAHSSDDSVSAHGATSVEFCTMMQACQAVSDSLGCMTISPKKTNYTLGQMLEMLFSEFTTSWYMGSKYIELSNRIICMLAPQGGSYSEEIKNLCRFPATALEKGHPWLAYYCSREIMRHMHRMWGFNKYSDTKNEIVEYLKDNGMWEASVFHGLTPQLDPVSACADPILLDVVRGRAQDWTAKVLSKPVTAATRSEIPVKWGTNPEESTISHATIYGAVGPGTTSWIRGITHRNIDKKKMSKKYSTNMLKAIKILAPETIGFKNNRASVGQLVSLGLAKTKEACCYESTIEAIERLEDECELAKSTQTRNMAQQDFEILLDNNNIKNHEEFEVDDD